MVRRRITRRRRANPTPTELRAAEYARTVAYERRKVEEAYRIVQEAPTYLWTELRNKHLIPATRRFYQALKAAGWQPGDPVPGGRPEYGETRTRVPAPVQRGFAFNPSKPRSAAAKRYKAAQSSGRKAVRERAPKSAWSHVEIPLYDQPGHGYRTAAELDAAASRYSHGPYMSRAGVLRSSPEHRRTGLRNRATMLALARQFAEATEAAKRKAAKRKNARRRR